jgi:hypothetical protein
MKQSELNNYFNTLWLPNLQKYQYSGWQLIDKVSPSEHVLDVGCGPNLFKGKIPNLTGIDPAFVEADYQTTIEEFQTDQRFDVAFCLGSINFGNKLTVMNQIACVVNHLKPTARIYWRCNPGIADHGNEACKMIEFYPWTLEEHVKLSELFGFKLTVACWDDNRIYAEWSRSA